MAIEYKNIHKGIFKSRPNRFIANAEINGQPVICHVKNTGRCRELLIPDAVIYLEKSDNPNRKTAYDLVAVEKGERLINMDSQIPNKVIEQWLKDSNLLGKSAAVKPESVYENSRFDFYIESADGSRKAYAEVKGCTLENNGVCMFPDAPTQRGLKHINELISCKSKGFEAYIIFLIQMNNVKYFTPNYATHEDFGNALKAAKKAGVNIIALDSIVTPTSIEAGYPVEIRL